VTLRAHCSLAYRKRKPSEKSDQSGDEEKPASKKGKDRPFACHLCSSRFARRFHLKRHLSCVHGTTKLPAATRFMVESDPRQKCRLCGRLSSERRMERHLLTCRGGAEGTGAGAEASGEAGAEESLLRYMRDNPEGGFLTDATVRSYSREVQRLIVWCRDPKQGNRPNLSLASIARVASATGDDQNFDYLPPASEALADVKSAHVGVQFNCAYLKLTGWLLHLLSLARSARTITAEEYVARAGIISGERDRAKPLRCGLRKRQREQRRTDRAQRQEEGLPPWTPERKGVKALVQAYRTSPCRSELLAILADLPLLAQDDPRHNFVLADGSPAFSSPQRIRDVLFLELLHFQGVRPDALLRTTLGNFQARRLLNEEGAPPGERTYYWNVPVHKSSDKYGEETVLATEQTVDAIQGYLEILRPQLLQSAPEPIVPLSPQDLATPLFPANGGTKLQSLKACVEVLYSIVNPPAREPGLKPYSFRKLMGAFGFESDDPLVRRDVASAMCHSELVADRCYRPSDARAKRKNKIAKAFVASNKGSQSKGDAPTTSSGSGTARVAKSRDNPVGPSTDSQKISSSTKTQSKKPLCNLPTASPAPTIKSEEKADPPAQVLLPKIVTSWTSKLQLG